MLSDHCLSVLSVCLVTLVYCGQTVGWIKMPLATEVGLGQATLCYMKTQLPPKRAQQPTPLSAHVYCGQTVAHLIYC